MSMSIDTVIITPMQRLVLGISPATPEPLLYSVTLTGRGGQEVEGLVHGLVYRSEPLYRPELYDIRLTAEYEDPDDNITTSILGLSTDVPAAMGLMLRQAIWDICFEAGLQLGDRPVFMIHDGWMRPTTIRQGDVPDMPLPAIEIGMPILRATAFQSQVRKREEWRVPLRILDDIHKENPNELGGVWLLAEMVQAAVDLTPNINLGGRGVLDKAWAWRIMEDADQERDRMSGLRVWLTVFVERCVGAVG